MPLTSSPRWRIALILALYGYQGLVAGFALTAVPNHYVAQGLASLAEVGAHLALVGLPWVLQPLWGPVVDRFSGWRMGRRRGWVVLAQGAALLSLTPLLWAAPGNLAALGGIFLAHGLFATLMDTATDGWIIDRVPPEGLGSATACTRAGFVTGLAVGAALFAWLLPALGLNGTATILLGLGATLALAPLLVRETTGDALLSLSVRAACGLHSFGALLAELGRELTRPATLALLAFCAVQDFAGALFRVPLGVALLQEEGWSAEGLSAVQGAMGFVAGTAGALVVGWWTDRVGASRSLGLLLGAGAAAHLVAGALLLGSVAAMPAALVLSTVISALSFVALAPAVMRASAGPVAASRFTLYMAALNSGDVVGSAASAPVAAALGLPGSALVSAALLLAAALVARRMLRLIT